MLIQNQVETNEYLSQNCSLSLEDRQDTWNNFEDSIRENEQDVTMIIPCDMTEDVTGKTLQWTLSLAKYTPEEGFHGQDRITVNLPYNTAVIESQSWEFCEGFPLTLLM